MNIQTIISTMNLQNIDNIKSKLNTDNLVIINQCNEFSRKIVEEIKILNFDERGLSKSRNRAIENFDSEIAILTDDDVVFVEDYKTIVSKAFKENPDIDIITFKIDTPEGNPLKKYSDSSYLHNKKTILKVSSIEIAVRCDSIKKNLIRYDERFGLGSEYISGEENLFLMDCINNNLKIKYIPKTIAIHYEITSGKVLNERAIYCKGALFYRLFGFKCFILNLAFILKKHRFIEFSIIKSILLIYKGTIDFIKKYGL